MIRIFLLSIFYAANTFSYVDKGETFEYLKSELILNHGFSEDYVVSTLNKAIKQDKIIQSISEPAEFTWTWDRYKDLFIEEKRIQNGKKFIDFATGIAVSNLGHCHPRLVKALNEQSKSIWHLSNVLVNQPALKLAKLLCQKTFAEKVFFTNARVTLVSTKAGGMATGFRCHWALLRLMKCHKAALAAASAAISDPQRPH